MLSVKKKVNLRLIVLVVVLFVFAIKAHGAKDSLLLKSDEKKKSWYELISLRGYAQIRYNRLFETNEKLKCEQCDKSWGENGGVFLRRARLIFSGNVHDRVYIYIQPDLVVSASSTNLHFLQLRDLYFDLALDKKKQYRIRIGQSKVPYGFENMQSSQNRISFDRADPTNSAVANERDLGVFFYFAPQKIRERFADLVTSGLKGSGDYGVFAIGAYNGQTANKAEANNELHVVARLTYPFQFSNGQIIEPGIQAYKGKYVVTSENRSVKVKGASGFSYADERVAASFVLYPKPFGIQAEYNIGRGPQFSNLTDSIETKSLEGGYLTAIYRLKLKKQLLFPFVKYQYYKGGKKHELDARSYKVYETEMGLEWQPHKNFELTTSYVFSDRRFEDMTTQNNWQKGKLMRIQAQFNF
ncbi:MAG: porin [Bacteroidetes bacterium]|nr:porin [Bacteroidota bacterium]